MVQPLSKSVSRPGSLAIAFSHPFVTLRYHKAQYAAQHFSRERVTALSTTRDRQKNFPPILYQLLEKLQVYSYVRPGTSKSNKPNLKKYIDIDIYIYIVYT